MLTVQKVTQNPVVDFAAEELKKYLRMMMPDDGDVLIRYGKTEEEGYRLGLMEDFGIPCPEAKDLFLDDVVYIDTDERGGIIAGSNPRSILQAVYRFLRENGCRWFFPGVDGERIPLKKVTGVKYRRMADHRFRGQCNEGAEYQQDMLETIDFFPKIGLNVYMMEFFNPAVYYNRYYVHRNNESVREPEPVPESLILQWKRQCEAEINKRGLQFHDIGHGWAVDPFGIDSTKGWIDVDQTELSPEKSKYLAEINGKRALFEGVAICTNFCMSNPEARAIVNRSITDYAEKHSNSDYLHVWLADNANNHCECATCRTKRVSDWYVMMLNELDEMLTERKLETRIAFIAYVETIWPPLTERIKHPKRFTLLYTAERLATDQPRVPIAEYNLNHQTFPKTVAERNAYLTEWNKVWKGDKMTYGYHFHRLIHYDPSQLKVAKQIYDDILAQKELDLGGIIEDGTQRCFFPNGFALYVFAETLFDRSVKFEDLKKTYFTELYGKNAREALDYFEKIAAVFDNEFLSQKYAWLNGEVGDKNAYFAPEYAEKLKVLHDVAAEARQYIPVEGELERPERIARRLWMLHTDYLEYLTDVMIAKTLRKDQTAREVAERFKSEFGQHEYEIERYFDQYHFFSSIGRMLRSNPGPDFGN